MLYLIPFIQCYEWGKRGNSSLVATLAQSSYSKVHNESLSKATSGVSIPFVVSPATPYAELWMGVHAKGSAFVINDDKKVTTHPTVKPLASHLESLQPPVELPFLFKVLSVHKPLSIQAHPDAKTAESLFFKNPQLYPDSNAKPEMAIALGHLDLLCGFRSLYEIAFYITETPELLAMLQTRMESTSSMKLKSLSDNFKASFNQPEMTLNEHDPQTLKEVVASLLRAPGDEIKNALTEFMQRTGKLIQKADQNKDKGQQLLQDAYRLMRRLELHFPGDRGVFFALLLNFIRLENGEGIFIAANKLHAYIEGDCIECMANSDNVIRGGLTPKHKDVELLIDTLDFSGSVAQVERVIPEQVPVREGCVKLYKPCTTPFQVFSVYQLTGPTPSKKVECCFSKVSPAIGIVIKSNDNYLANVNGCDHKMKCGDCFILQPGEHFTLKNQLEMGCPADANDEFILYVAASPDPQALKGKRE